MKNAHIELCRFIGAIIILCHHTYLFENRTYFVTGWLFVEFYFMLTGYFTAMHFFKTPYLGDNIYKDAFKYMLDKIYRILPYAWSGITLLFIYYIVSGHEGPVRHTFISLPTNLLLLMGSPLNKGLLDFNPPLWFIGQIIVFLPLIICVMIKFTNVYKYLLSWLLPFVLYLFNIEAMGHAIHWNSNIYLYARGLSALVLGTTLYFLVTYVESNYNHIIKRLQRHINNTFYLLFVVYIIMICRSKTDNLEIAIPLIIGTFCLLSITLFTTFNMNKHYQLYKIFSYIGKLSLPIYCLHMPVLYWIQFLIPHTTYSVKLLLAIMVSCLIAGLLVSLVNRITPIIKRKLFYLIVE